MKKHIATLLVIVLTLSLLAACSGGGDNNTGNNNTNSNNTPSSTPGDNNTPSSDTGGTVTTVQPSSDRVELDQVVWDGEGMKVTLTGYQYRPLWEDYCFYFTLENHTDKNIRARFERASVSGCMITGSSFSENERTDAGETREDTKLIIGRYFLEDRGIDKVQDVEFIIFFLDLDDVQNELFNTGLITIAGPDSGSAAQTFEAEGIPVFDGGGVKVTVMRADNDIMGGAYNGVWVYIENNSGFDIEIGTIASPGLSCEISNGKVAYDYVLYSTLGSDFQFHSETLSTALLSFKVYKWDEETHSFNGEEIQNTLGDEYGSLDVSFDASGNVVSAANP